MDGLWYAALHDGPARTIKSTIHESSALGKEGSSIGSDVETAVGLFLPNVTPLTWLTSPRTHSECQGNMIQIGSRMFRSSSFPAHGPST